MKEEMYQILGLLNPLMLFYVMLFGLFFFNKYIKLQKEKNEFDKKMFTRDEVLRIKTKMKLIKETGNDEIFNKYINNNLISNYNDAFIDSFYEVMNDLDVFCDGILTGIYSEDFSRVYFGKNIKEYYYLANKMNSFSSQEMFVNIELLLNKWNKENKNKGSMK